MGDGWEEWVKGRGMLTGEVSKQYFPAQEREGERKSRKAAGVDMNVLARAVMKKGVKVGKFRPDPVSAPASSVLALIKSKLPASAPVLPRGTPILAPKAKVKPEKKGDAS